jgi:hypothetical protein
MATNKAECVAAGWRDTFTGKSLRTGQPITVRVNGKCQTWKTRPDEFRLPVKYGLRDCGYIDQNNADNWTKVR